MWDGRKKLPYAASDVGQKFCHTQVKHFGLTNQHRCSISGVMQITSEISKVKEAMEAVSRGVGERVN